MKKISYILISIILLSSCEQEWQIDISDCREKINISDKYFSNIFNTYTCNTDKTEKWHIISWECSYVVISRDKCLKSYTYKKEPSYNCGENSHLEYKWCFCDYWYFRNNNECLKKITY